MRPCPLRLSGASRRQCDILTAAPPIVNTCSLSCPAPTSLKPSDPVTQQPRHAAVRGPGPPRIAVVARVPEPLVEERVDPPLRRCEEATEAGRLAPGAREDLAHGIVGVVVIDHQLGVKDGQAAARQRPEARPLLVLGTGQVLAEAAFAPQLGAEGPGGVGVAPTRVAGREARAEADRSQQRRSVGPEAFTTWRRPPSDLRTSPPAVPASPDRARRRGPTGPPAGSPGPPRRQG